MVVSPSSLLKLCDGLLAYKDKLKIITTRHLPTSRPVIEARTVAYDDTVDICLMNCPIHYESWQQLFIILLCLSLYACLYF